MVRELEGRGVRNVRLWGRGIDVCLYTPEARDPALRAQLGADDDRPLLLLVSRLVKEKDLTDLIKMDRVLRKRGFDYRFAFVGDGPLRRKLARGLPEAHFAGQQTGAELARCTPPPISSSSPRLPRPSATWSRRRWPLACPPSSSTAAARPV